MKVLEDRRFYLVYLIVYIASKQALKILGGKKVRLVYLVVCTDKSCRKVAEGRRVSLIYLVFHSK